MAQNPLRPKSRNDIRVAIVCALPLEAEMVRHVFDKDWDSEHTNYGKARRDHNTYTTGVIGTHNVVLVHMPGIGNVDAATVAAGIRSSYTGIDIVFVVGICGANPKSNAKEDVILGDCIVSTAVVQYDSGRQYPGGFRRKTGLEESLGRAHPTIRSLLAKLQTSPTPKHLSERLALHLESLQRREPTAAAYPGWHRDRLFNSAYLHIHHDSSGPCDKCIEETGGVCSKDCDELGCEDTHLLRRPRLDSVAETQIGCSPRLHFGRYGSASLVLKSGADRDRLAEEDDILAFEMEGAGIWETMPTLIIKSACDYADSHKNKEWQPFAAATAAAALKAILEKVEVTCVISEQNYGIPFSLDRVPIAKKFIDRPKEMHLLEDSLIPCSQRSRNVFVLRGLGGIGKTQLAVNFMRKHHGKFSAVFWLDGTSVDSLKQSIAIQASRVSADQMSEQSRAYATTGKGEVDIIIAEFMTWLELVENNGWLMVFDNVDREFVASDPLSYDIKTYIPSADHGSILITTRLTQLERLGDSKEVKKVDGETAKAILNTWHDCSQDANDIEALLDRLDGLPLAIAQAGSYLHQSSIGLHTYLRLYDEQNQVVGEAIHKSDTLLDDYPNRSIWTTWNISYKAINAKNKHVANLLILWSFLDRNDLWYGLFERALSELSSKEDVLHMFGDIIDQEISFNQAMTLLRSYSLIEGSERKDGYSMHTVVHRWVYFYHGMQHVSDLGLLALKLVGHAVPISDERDYARLLQRLLPHANICLTRVGRLDEVVSQNALDIRVDGLLPEHVGLKDFFHAVYMLGNLYMDHGKLVKAEQMLLRALSGRKSIGDKHEDTLRTVNALGSIYHGQGRLEEAEQMLLRALAGCEALDDKHQNTLITVNNLGNLYSDQGRLAEAEQMYVRALTGQQQTLSDKHTDTLMTVNNLGNVYGEQGRLTEAEQMLKRALAGYEEAFGDKHTDTLMTVNNLGNVYGEQGRLAEAEQMLKRALAGYEEVFGAENCKTSIRALNSMWGLANVWSTNRPEESRAMYEKALAGYTRIRGASDPFCITLKQCLEELDEDQVDSLGCTAPELRAMPDRSGKLGKKRKLGACLSMLGDESRRKQR